MNEQLTHQVLKDAIRQGVKEFCVCPGARCGPLVTLLAKEPRIRKYYWFEERSAAYFALGRSRSTGNPAAVITTSGTAAGELLPAMMEAYYTGVPLLAITSDRPRRFRGTGAPQTAEQVGIFGRYAVFEEDLEEAELSYLHLWDRQGPAHVNVCFEEPLQINDIPLTFYTEEVNGVVPSCDVDQGSKLDSFFDRCSFPFVVVSALEPSEREPVVNFLEKVKAPVFLEGISGIRENKKLQHLRIARTSKIRESAERSLYPIDGVLRIGGVPTFRLWRDLEELEYKIEVCSVSRVPFTGLSWGSIIHAPIGAFFQKYECNKEYGKTAQRWIEDDHQYRKSLHNTLMLDKDAEASMVFHLSELIPPGSLVYLGNSLPIREWDFAAVDSDKNFIMKASRGLNGIDGQISTFLGLCEPGRENWAILGDLTALYDMAGLWILRQLPGIKVRIVILNNGGGQIFAGMFQEKEFLHEHNLSFEPLAKMWGLEYQRWDTVPLRMGDVGNVLIEAVPNVEAGSRICKI